MLKQNLNPIDAFKYSGQVSGNRFGYNGTYWGADFAFVGELVGADQFAFNGIFNGTQYQLVTKLEKQQDLPVVLTRTILDFFNRTNDPVLLSMLFARSPPPPPPLQSQAPKPASERAAGVRGGAPVIQEDPAVQAAAAAAAAVPKAVPTSVSPNMLKFWGRLLLGLFQDEAGLASGEDADRH